MANLLAVLILIAFSFGQTLKFSFYSPDIKFTLLDVGVFVLTISALALNRPRLHVVHPIFFFGAAALLSLVIFGSRYGSTALLAGSLYLVRWVIYSLSPFSLAVVFSPFTIRRLLWLAGISVVVTSLYQYLFFPDIRHLQVLEWDPHYFRVVGTWLDPGFTGLLLVFILIFLTITQNLSKAVRFVSWILTYVAFALTYSRSSYLAFLVSMSYISWRQRSPKFFAFIILLFTLTIYLLPRPGGEGVQLERTSSIYARLHNWQNSLTIFSRYPLLGVGFNTYRYAQKQFGYLDSSAWLASHAGAGADSSLLFVAATTGIIGLSAYLLYLRSLVRLTGTDLTLQSVLLALIGHSLFLNSLFYPAVLLWLGLLLSPKVRT